MEKQDIKIGVFPRPLCTDPTLLCNRNALKLLLAGAELREYYDKDRKRYKSAFVTADNIHDMQIKSYLRHAHALVKNMKLNSQQAIEKLSRYVVVIGQHYEFLYQLAPCGKCELCQEKKLNDFSNRCQWESQTSETKCLFVTFTYENEQVPMELKECDGRVAKRGIPCAEQYRKWADEFSKTHSQALMQLQPMYKLMQYQRGQGLTCKHDMQKFFQDLRNHIRRSDNPLLHKDRPLRYAWCMEKGTKSGHPHYHALLWNLPLDVDNETVIGQSYLAQMTDMINEAWSYGNVYIEVAKSAARYVAKYVGKDTGAGISRLYCSNRGGGIGAKFLEQFKQVAEKSPEMQTIVGVDKWDSSQFSHTMGQFATNKLFPPLRQYVATTEYQQMYETLTYRLTDHIKLGSHILSELEWNDYATKWFNTLKKLRVTEDNRFMPLPKWEYFQQVVDPDEADIKTIEQNRKKQQEFANQPNDRFEYWSKHKNRIYSATINELVEELQYLVADMPTDIDNKLSLRRRHQLAIPVQTMSDDFIYMKKLQVQAKQTERKGRETF